MKLVHRLISAAAAFLMLSGTAACGTSSEGSQTAPDFGSLPAIALTSEDLHDGVWDTDITKTEKGSNRSPQLSWQPVEGAACYAVYMVDITVTNWLHWKSGNVAETTLPAGWAPETEYVGPYPPSGTHDYEIRVFALKEAVTEEKSKFDNSNYGFEKITAALDQGSSGSGNVLAYGTLTGSFTRS